MKLDLAGSKKVGCFMGAHMRQAKFMNLMAGVLIGIILYIAGHLLGNIKVLV